MAMLDRLKHFILGGTDEDEGCESPRGEARVTPFEPCAGKVILVRPDAYVNVGLLSSYLCAGYVVLIDLDHISSEGARRIVDFLSGAAYSRDGTLTRISCKAYLLAPCGVDVNDWNATKGDEWEYDSAFNF